MNYPHHRLGQPGARHPHLARRTNPALRHRSMNISWCPDDDVIVRECLENWLIPVNVEKLLGRGGASLTSSTGRVLLRDFLRWAQKNIKTLNDADEFFESTPFGEALKWFKDLNLQRVGKDYSRLERMTYGNDTPKN